MRFAYHIRPFRPRVVALLFAMWSFGGVPPASAQGQVLVIAHTSVPADTVSKTELLDFYTGEVRLWDNGDQVTVFDLKAQSETREAFYGFLGKPSSRIKSIWLRRKLSGEGDPPERLASEADVLERVKNTPGAIGFVALNATPRDVKVLTRFLLD